MKLAFVCIQNAGRSQMATAFARRERKRRGLDAAIEVVTGGTRPAASLHDVVLTVMRERGIDLSNRTPREITPEELDDCDYVVAMGCTADGVCPATWSEESRDWGLADPHGEDIDTVRDIRDTVEARVSDLFDELTGSTTASFLPRSDRASTCPPGTCLEDCPPADVDDVSGS